jgi:hypothetical protein
MRAFAFSCHRVDINKSLYRKPHFDSPCVYRASSMAVLNPSRGLLNCLRHLLRSFSNTFADVFGALPDFFHRVFANTLTRASLSDGWRNIPRYTYQVPNKVVGIVVRSSTGGEGPSWRIAFCLQFGCCSRGSTSCRERRQADCPKPGGQDGIGRFPPKVACCACLSDWLAQLELSLTSCRSSRVPPSQTVRLTEHPHGAQNGYRPWDFE